MACHCRNISATLKPIYGYHLWTKEAVYKVQCNTFYAYVICFYQQQFDPDNKTKINYVSGSVEVKV